MTTPLPVPLPTDPIADAALHIRNLAEAVETHLTTTYTLGVFDSGELIANSDGSIPAGNMTQLTTIAGSVSTSVALYENSNHTGGVGSGSDLLYMGLPVRDPSVGIAVWHRMFNAPTNTVNQGKYQRVRGLAWGPAAGLAHDDRGEPFYVPYKGADPPIDADYLRRTIEATPDAQAANLVNLAAEGFLVRDPAPIVAPAALPPGSVFAAGKTAHGLRYPGTSDPQWKVAQFISELADDIGKALGGTPQGLTLAVARDVYIAITSGSPHYSSYIQANFTGKLSWVRGAVATSWDASGGYPQTRLFTQMENGSWIDPSIRPWARFFVSSNVKTPNSGNYPQGFPNGSGHGASIIAWGDPP